MRSQVFTGAALAAVGIGFLLGGPAFERAAIAQGQTASAKPVLPVFEVDPHFPTMPDREDRCTCSWAREGLVRYPDFGTRKPVFDAVHAQSFETALDRIPFDYFDTFFGLILAWLPVLSAQLRFSKRHSLEMGESEP